MNFRIWDKEAAEFVYFTFADIFVGDDKHDHNFRYVWNINSGQKVKLDPSKIQRGTGKFCCENRDREIFEGDRVYVAHPIHYGNEYLKSLQQENTFEIGFDKGAFFMYPLIWTEGGTICGTPLKFHDGLDEEGNDKWKLEPPAPHPLWMCNIVVVIE